MAPVYRICIVAPGASIHAKRWADGLHDKGHELLWVQTGGGKGRETLAHKFVPRLGSKGLADSKWARMAAYFEIRSTISNFAPDVVHLHYLRGDRLIDSLSRSWPRFIVSVWGSDVAIAGSGPTGKRVDERKKSLLRKASRVTATSNFLAEQTRSRFNMDLPVDVIPFGVDLSVFSPKAHAEVAQHPMIGFIKTYSPGYGPQVLLEAMSTVHRRLPNVRLLMRGFGDPEPYRVQAAELGLTECVTIEGGVPHEEVPEIMRRIDVFCMPSIDESFGVAAAEASACGLPVVASRTGGVPEVVKDQLTGILVEPNNPSALADALYDMVSDPSRMAVMGEAGRASVRKTLDWNQNLCQMEAVYEAVLSSSIAQGHAAPTV